MCTRLSWIHSLLAAALVSAVALTGCTSQSQLRRWYVEGLDHQKDGDDNAARHNYEQILAGDARFEGAHNNLAVLDARTGKLDEALAHLRAELDASPTVVAARTNEVLVLMMRGEHAEANRRGLNLLGTFPEDPPAHLVSALAALAAGEADAERTEASLGVVIAKGTVPMKAHAWFARGLLRARQERWAEAAEDFAETTRTRRDAVAHYNRAVALAADGQGPEAVSELERAAALDDSAAAIPHLLALLHYRVGDSAAAHAAIERAAALEAKRPGLAGLQGLVYFAREEWAAAADSFRQAATEAPEAVAPAFNLGLVLTHLGDVEGAHTAFARAAELAPGDALAAQNRDALKPLLP